MAITSAIVLYAVTWFMVMFVTLPIGLRTQGDMGEKVEGTHDGAPANFRLKRTILIVTAVSFVIWVVLVLVITSGMISVRDFDWAGRLGPDKLINEYVLSGELPLGPPLGQQGARVRFAPDIADETDA